MARTWKDWVTGFWTLTLVGSGVAAFVAWVASHDGAWLAHYAQGALGFAAVMQVVAWVAIVRTHGVLDSILIWHTFPVWWASDEDDGPIKALYSVAWASVACAVLTTCVWLPGSERAAFDAALGLAGR